MTIRSTEHAASAIVSNGLPIDTTEFTSIAQADE
jgi:hypothetical protein